MGHSTYISKLRGGRPLEYLRLNPTDSLPLTQNTKEDSFCQIAGGKLPSIVLTRDFERNRDPFATTAKYEDLSQTKAFTIINLYPPMVRYLVKGSDSVEIENFIDKYPKGISLVHILTEHHTCLEKVPQMNLTMFIRNMILSLQICQEALYSKEITNFSLLQFFNIGALAGASIPHLHGQSLIITRKSGHGWRHQGFLVAYEEYKSALQDNSFCLGCEYSKKVELGPLGQHLNLKQRIIWENAYWMSLTAYAPETDGEIRIIPKRHVSNLLELNSDEIDSLSEVLIASNYALTEFICEFGHELHLSPDRNILLRQQHFGYTTNPHLLIDILPVQRIGGGEKLDTFKLSHVFPEDIASIMRRYLRKLGT